MNEEKKVKSVTPKKKSTVASTKKKEASTKASTAKKKTTTKKANTSTKTTAASKTKVSAAKKTPAKSTASKAATETKKSTTKKVSSASKSTGAKKTGTTKVATKSVPKKKKLASTSASEKSSGVTKKVAPSKTSVKTSNSKAKTTKKAPIKKDAIKEEKVKQDEKLILTQTIPEEVSLEPKENFKTEIKKEENESDIPVRNYLIAAIAIVWILIIVFLGFRLYDNHLEKLYDEGYFNHYNVNVKKTTLESVRSEVNASSKEDVFVLFNTRSGEDYFKLEKDLEQIMKDYKIQENFYYVDLTDYSGYANCDQMCEIRQALETNTLQKLPAIAYFRNKTLVDIAQREDDKVLEAADFVKLLDIYEFKK